VIFSRERELFGYAAFVELLTIKSRPEVGQIMFGSAFSTKYLAFFANHLFSVFFGPFTQTENFTLMK
jgi:hypothetical protein